jgi:hypothetical protein
MHENTEAICGFSEAVREFSCTFWFRAEQEHTLRASSGNHVGGSREDASGCCHTRLSVRTLQCCVAPCTLPHAVAFTTVDFSEVLQAVPLMRCLQSRVLPVLLVSMAVPLSGCGHGTNVSTSAKTAPKSKTPLALGDAQAKNAQGESVRLHRDGSFEYRNNVGAQVTRGRLTDDSILDSSGRVLATIAADGTIIDSDPVWVTADTRIDLDGSYSIHGNIFWKLDRAGDLVETMSGGMVLRTSEVEPQLRRAMVLTQIAMGLLHRAYGAP